MKNLVHILAIAVLGITSNTAFGQQEPHFTQYFDNTLFVNPAYAGSNGAMNITGIHRQQWVGFDGRPQSTTLGIHSPLRYESVGMGLTLVHDVVGPLTQTMIYGDFSYTINFKNNKSKLSFGLKGGVNLINVGTNTLATTEANDPKLLQNVRNRVNPNFGAGIYYHTPSFFVGVSSPKILEQSYDGINKRNLEKRHFFGIIGGVIKVSSDWKIRPTSQVKVTAGAPMSIDMSLAGIYQDKFWFGAMYRLNAAFGGFVQYQFTPQFKLGLASDFGIQKIQNYNYGTYELLLSYDFIFKKTGIRSPRYF